jgi:hypothetical protein
MQDDNTIKPIAIYLPQFHPVPENDEWWGKGFTEWTNVSKAKPLYKNHYQPRLPADHGYYDLRLAEVREQQAALAKSYGIHGFCYYHYWFNGKRLIDRPFEEVLSSGSPDFPFMLCWANETWSRRWLGEEKEILLKQTYSGEDDYAHGKYLAKVFSDKRYIKQNGRPVFIIYRPKDFPDINATLKIFRKICIDANGVDPYFVASNSHWGGKGSEEIKLMGFDAIFNFRPQLGALPDAFEDEFTYQRYRRNFLKHGVADGKLKLYSYKEALKFMEAVEPASFENIMPCVFVGWDNTPRRNEKGIIIYDNTADLFEKELLRIKNKMLQSKNHEQFLFINAWNEWAEGNHLEPDQKNKHIYLQAVKNIFCKNE